MTTQTKANKPRRSASKKALLDTTAPIPEVTDTGTKPEEVVSTEPKAVTLGDNSQATAHGKTAIEQLIKAGQLETAGIATAIIASLEADETVSAWPAGFPGIGSLYNMSTENNVDRKKARNARAILMLSVFGCSLHPDKEKREAGAIILPQMGNEGVAIREVTGAIDQRITRALLCAGYLIDCQARYENAVARGVAPAGLKVWTVLSPETWEKLPASLKERTAPGNLGVMAEYAHAVFKVENGRKTVDRNPDCRKAMEIVESQPGYDPGHAAYKTYVWFGGTRVRKAEPFTSSIANLETASRQGLNIKRESRKGTSDGTTNVLTAEIAELAKRPVQDLLMALTNATEKSNKATDKILAEGLKPFADNHALLMIRVIKESLGAADISAFDKADVFEYLGIAEDIQEAVANWETKHGQTLDRGTRPAITKAA